MNRLLILGGRQRGSRTDEWQQYDQALAVEVELDAEGREVRPGRRVVEHVTPPQACAEGQPSIVFKSGSVHGDTLYACTQTEVLIYRIPPVGTDAAYEQIGYLSHPWFNDVHHVRPRANGNLLVVSTGLDLVLEMTPGGEVVEVWNVLGKDPWHRFDPDTDYRRVLTTKPHESHPNYVFEIGNPDAPEIWVTRFEQRDAVCLRRASAGAGATASDAEASDATRRIEIAVQRPHDGVVRDCKVHFTTVDGHVVVAEAVDSTAAPSVIDLNQIPGRKSPLGWCRGLDIWGDGLALVGFSRLRPTRFGQNVRWLRQQLGAKTSSLWPTRVALYDLPARRLVWEWSGEDLDLNVIFSCYRLPTGTGPK